MGINILNKLARPVALEDISNLQLEPTRVIDRIPIILFPGLTKLSLDVSDFVIDFVPTNPLLLKYFNTFKEIYQQLYNSSPNIGKKLYMMSFINYLAYLSIRSVTEPNYKVNTVVERIGQDVINYATYEDYDRNITISMQEYEIDSLFTIFNSWRRLTVSQLTGRIKSIEKYKGLISIFRIDKTGFEDLVIEWSKGTTLKEKLEQLTKVLSSSLNIGTSLALWANMNLNEKDLLSQVLTLLSKLNELFGIGSVSIFEGCIVSNIKRTDYNLADKTTLSKIDVTFTFDRALNISLETLSSSKDILDNKKIREVVNRDMLFNLMLSMMGLASVILVNISTNTLSQL